jgi:Uma2 family endonuclease
MPKYCSSIGEYFVGLSLTAVYPASPMLRAHRPRSACPLASAENGVIEYRGIMQRSIGNHPKYYERLDGRRYAKVSPQRQHSLLQRKLAELIAGDAGGRGEVGTEWKFYVGRADGSDSALQPDVSFVSYERLDRLGDRGAEKPPFAPDIAAEIRSPDDRPGLLRQKIARYLGTGSVLAIVVDPASRTVTAYDAAGATAYAQTEVFAHAAAPWLRFSVADLFAVTSRARP